MSNQLLMLLAPILGQPDHYSGGETYWNCPFCVGSKKKLAINFHKKKWHCWKCNARGNSLRSFVERLAVTPHVKAQLLDAIVNAPAKLETPKATHTKVVLPEEFIPLSSEYDSMGVEYLNRRNISKHQIIKYNIGICRTGKYHDRIIFPSYDHNDELNYFVARDVTGRARNKYLNPPVSKNTIALESHVNWNFPVVLCEGFFDAAAIKVNPIPLLGKTVQNTLFFTLIEHRPPMIYVCLDNDASAYGLKIVRRLLNQHLNCSFVSLPPQMDPADMQYQELYELVHGSESVDFKKLIELELQTNI